MVINDSLFRYWGKADPNYTGTQKWHPLVYHCLDVAACGDVLLNGHPEWQDKLAHLSGIAKDKLKPWLILLLALHDIGKFAKGFQQLPGNPFGLDVSIAYDQRHDTLGFALASENLLAWLGRSPNNDFDWLMASPWFAAVTGHHGLPPKDQPPQALVRRHFQAETLRDVETFVTELRNLLCPESWCLSEPDVCPPERQQQTSWLVAGLAVLADWLGSNTHWFKYRAADYSLLDYWLNVALPSANRAVTESGLAGAKPVPQISFQDMFPVLAQAPTPLQAWADSVAIGQGPQLFILEELTGAGKTEAALTLAGRLMAAGQASGVYFALPTMATADAMYRRVRKVNERDETWRRFFTEGEASLVLAHSAAKTARKLEALSVERDSGYGHERTESSASQTSAAWLADSRKKALLADFGVGTIDQALLAVTQLRHQSLRLLGLSSKVLVVDEVHACDCYMGELLGRLLQFHAALGGSTILLSATLPLEQRTRLLKHFAQGAGLPAPQLDSRNAYPLATHLRIDDFTESQVDARPEVSRSVAADVFPARAGMNRI